MDLPRDFVSFNNFELAYRRIVRGVNKDYKQFYAHLFPSYDIALRVNLLDLIGDIRKGTYKPSVATVIFQPKKSGVLRPLGLLSLRDLIVYQAIANRVANSLEKTQSRYALKRSYGALYAGKQSEFFFRSWKVCWGKFVKGVTVAFKGGAHWISDFDLVSFYELIDHNLLRSCLRKQIKHEGLLNFVTDCLSAWTTDAHDGRVRHGIPQGPEASAFLAECILFNLDSVRIAKVKYFRYIDDIRLMSDEESRVRRSLLRLDLESKKLGLVPQAQKIETRRASGIGDVIKSLPSGAAQEDEFGQSKISQSRLRRMLKRSLRKSGRSVAIQDVTRFKFALNRLAPRVTVLRQIRSLFVTRFDLSWTLAAYARRFNASKTAAAILIEALRQNPVYDSTAAHYIDALARCQPVGERNAMKVLRGIRGRSEEKSFLLIRAYKEYVASRMTSRGAITYISQEKNPRIVALLVHRLFQIEGSPFKPSDAAPLLEELVSSTDEDAARYAIAALMNEWPWSSTLKWKPPPRTNRSVKLTMKALGLRSRVPAKAGVLASFFKDRMSIAMQVQWRKALGKDLRDVESRCLRLQKLMSGDPTARVLILDTFNEVLLQNFSRKNPMLAQPYNAAAGGKNHPDYGAWLNNGHFAPALPKGIGWFRSVHNLRVKADLAHAKAKKGARTKPVTYKQADALMRKAQTPWAELIIEWKKFLT